MSIEITPLSASLGAEVRGVDLSCRIDAPTREALNRAFVAHSVLVVRGQTLSAQAFLGAVQNFGAVFEQHNTRFALPECPKIHYISNQDRYADGRRYIPGAGYHTDHSNDPVPPKATALLAIVLPETGGDTQFVDMRQAYDDLPDEMKGRIDGLRCRHVYQSKHSARKLMGLTPQRQNEVPPSAIHPLVRTHPESGRRSLYLNPIRIEEIVGMPETDALALLEQLLAHATQEKYQYRHRWRPGDLVMWDNRCLLHKANGDYPGTQTRYLYRVMLKGTVPC
jgi:taurine dioxygenase